MNKNSHGHSGEGEYLRMEGAGIGAGGTELSLFLRGGEGYEPEEKLPTLKRCVGKAVFETLVNSPSAT